MKTPIYYNEKTYTCKINKAAKFILIGNNIDGFVEFNFCEFKNFKTVEEELPVILFSLKACGEWDIKLYQVEDSYEIVRKYGYYKYPKKGKLIYTHSYMDSPIKDVQFRTKSIIFIGCVLEVEENWLTDEVFYIEDLMIEITKVNIN
jgi:hypothetical protein